MEVLSCITHFESRNLTPHFENSHNFETDNKFKESSGINKTLDIINSGGKLVVPEYFATRHFPFGNLTLIGVISL